jgi:hypothetical protein
MYVVISVETGVGDFHGKISLLKSYDYNDKKDIVTNNCHIMENRSQNTFNFYRI